MSTLYDWSEPTFREIDRVLEWQVQIRDTRVIHPTYYRAILSSRPRWAEWVMDFLFPPKK